MKRIATDSLVSPDELRAAAEVHRELGPEYDRAVVESFVERLGSEIDARVDAQIAQALQAGAGQSRANSFRLAVISMALGIPLTAIALGATSEAIGLIAVLVIWLAMAVINVAYSISSRPGRPRH
jgi:hypothetical protein